MNEQTIRNARVVTADEEFIGCVHLQDGIIRSVDRGDTTVAGAQDWAGDWLMPGLDEMHTYNLENHLVPRP
jgi:alpha-D-ribose 1-methylphosphonate 5-triphosphate diphosphatase